MRKQCASRSTDAALWWSFPWRSMSGFVRRRSAQTKPQQVSGATRMHGLSERDICRKFITPAFTAAGWNMHTQIREVVNLPAVRFVFRGKLTSRGKQKRAEYIHYHKPKIQLD